MKKYSSGSFIDAAVRVYGSEADILTSFPASIITTGGNITPWTIYGNSSGAQSVGEKTANSFDNVVESGYYNDSGVLTPDAATGHTVDYITVDDTTYTISNLWYNPGFMPAFAVYEWDENKEWLRRSNRQYPPETNTITFSIGNDTRYITLQIAVNHGNIMLNTGSIALPYEPYGYKLTVVIGSNTTNIYIADVLRKSIGADPVYDIMSSTGVITRNVDTDGTPVVTPTTESFTAPTLATVAGSQSVSFDTTVKPSKADLTYTGWHTHSDKKRSGGAWT